MREYPIKINIKIYRGSDESKIIRCNLKIEIANKIEKYLNKKMEECKEKDKSFEYWKIANDLNLNIKDVTDILSPIDGGFYGITIGR